MYFGRQKHVAFWQNHLNDDLRKIAEVVLYAPSTHVSVERALSTLKFAQDRPGSLPITTTTFTIVSNESRVCTMVSKPTTTTAR